MNDQTDDLDQAAEDILTYAVPDEALEAAAGTERGAAVSLIERYCWPGAVLS